MSVQPGDDDDWPDVALPDWAEPQKGSDVHTHEHDPERGYERHRARARARLAAKEPDDTANL